MIRVPLRVPAILIIGPTGSGKTPLGNALEAEGMNGLRCIQFFHECAR